MHEHIEEKKKKRKLFILPLILLTSAILLSIVFWYQGIIIPNALRANHYPVKGIDVSSYQGEIEWTQFEKQGIKFAFIKATEGSTFVDEYFERNW